MNSEEPTITEADLHAYVDGQLSGERCRAIEAHLARRPEEAQRLKHYRTQKQELRSLFDPVLDEPLPERLVRSAKPRTPWYAQRLAAGIAIAVVSGGVGYGIGGGIAGSSGRDSVAQRTPPPAALVSASEFAQRAAVAHAVYSVDQRRSVEVDAAHEDQLIAWLSKRMGAPMRPPKLQTLGYALDGGRLLPGAQRPVAQFMYQKIEGDGVGGKLTLYVSNEVSDLTSKSPPGARGQNIETAFRFAREGNVNVFYWVDGPFGYAISADSDRSVLAAVSDEIHRQLEFMRR